MFLNMTSWCYVAHIPSFRRCILYAHGSHQDWKSGKTWKNGKAFSSQGILSRLEKSGNFTQNTGKIRKNYTGKLKRILEKSGKFVSQK